MSKKTNGQHWYQVHKSQAGKEFVSFSKEVLNARAKVQDLENQVSALNASNSNNVGACIRRVFFGKNQHEKRLLEIEQELQKAKADALLIEQKVRITGERAYAANWLAKNAD